MSEELMTAPEGQEATEPVVPEAAAAGGVEEAAAPATAAAEAAGAAAETGAAPTQEIDLDALIEKQADTILEKLRKRPDYAGKIGRDMQRLEHEIRERIREEEAQRQYLRAMAELKRQQEEAERRRKLEQLPDDEYGRLKREEERRRELEEQIGRQREEAVHRAWIARLMNGIPEEQQAQWRSRRWASEDEFLREALAYRARMEAEQRMNEIKQTLRQQVEQEVLSKVRAGAQRPDVTNGTPAGAVTRPTFKFADEAEAAFNRGQITAKELLHWRRRLPYSYSP